MFNVQILQGLQMDFGEKFGEPVWQFSLILLWPPHELLQNFMNNDNKVIRESHN